MSEVGGREGTDVGGHPSEMRSARHGHELHGVKRSEVGKGQKSDVGGRRSVSLVSNLECLWCQILNSELKSFVRQDSQDFTGYFLPFLLPATCPQCFATRGGRVASRSGEAGGEERQKVSTLFESKPTGSHLKY